MREPVEIDPRSKARFSKGEKHQILLRQSTNGIARCDRPKCEAILAILSQDGNWMKQQRFDFDHGHARALGGRTHKENGRALCIPCHKAKSALDERRLHKALRQGGGEGSQYARRQARKAAGERPLLQTKGFPKHG